MTFCLANDQRLRALSPQSRDLLERILRKFPHDDLFGSGVPAAPAQLRLTLYHSDDPRLDSQIGRQLKELELNSIGILRRVSRKTRYLKLTLDFSGAHEATLRTCSHRPVAGRAGTSHSDVATIFPVIHNPAGLSPPDDLQKIADDASSSSDPLDYFFTRAKPLLPQWLDLRKEWNKYVDCRRRKVGKEGDIENFIPWLLRTRRTFGKVRCEKRDARCAIIPNPESRNPDPDAQLDLFEERARVNFERQLRARRSRSNVPRCNG